MAESKETIGDMLEKLGGDVASLKQQLQEADAKLGELDAELRETIDLDGLARDMAQIEYRLLQATGKLLQ
jgi:hypothetical protein